MTFAPLESFNSIFSPTKCPEANISQTANLVYEVGRLLTFAPEITTKVKNDLDVAGIKKKQSRQKDKEWILEQSHKGLFSSEIDQVGEDVVLLNTGRPRIPDDLVVFFLFFRGMFSGFRAKISKELRAESFTLTALIYQIGLKKCPSETTIVENCNMIALSTIRYILKKQIELYFVDRLDAFREFYIDSTSTKANSLWPTESGLVLNFAVRLSSTFQYLFENYQVGRKLISKIEKHLKSIRSLHLLISMGTGKRNSKQKRKKHYKKIVKLGKELLIEFTDNILEFENDITQLNILPSEKDHIKIFLEMARQDIEDLRKTIENAEKRVLKCEKVKQADKILSISDSDAAIISKGEREPVLGYKPNVSRSKNGFIVAIEVPVGNAADSSVAVGMVEKSIDNTGFVPNVVSFDDGYTSANNKDELEEMGISIVSFSGSKGKKVSGEDEYCQAEFLQARNARSMVESSMNELKNTHNLASHSRRGLENVRCECIEVALAHNTITAARLRIKSQ